MNFTTLLLAAAVTLAVPLILAALGEAISENAGVLNIELEGMLLMGAMGGVLGAWWTGNAGVGYVVGAACSVALGIVHGYVCIGLGANQAVSGVVLNILALGVTSYVFATTLGDITSSVAQVPEFTIPGLSSLPLVGEVLFDHDVGVYLTFALVPMVAWVMSRTRVGLAVTAAGEDHASAAALGIQVNRVRWGALITCGLLAGAGGAQLSLAGLGFFTPNMTAGRGFIALAAVILASRRAWLVTAALLAFATADALSIRAQALGIDIPFQLLAMLPYVLTIVALIVFGARTRIPSSLGLSYEED